MSFLIISRLQLSFSEDGILTWAGRSAAELRLMHHTLPKTGVYSGRVKDLPEPLMIMVFRSWVGFIYFLPSVVDIIRHERR